MLPKGLPVENLVPAQDSAGAKAPKNQGMSLKSSFYKEQFQNHGCPIQHTIQEVWIAVPLNKETESAKCPLPLVQSIYTAPERKICD